MKRPVILLGCGGHARVLNDVLGLRGVKVLGATDASPEKAHGEIFILGKDEAVLKHDPAKIFLVNALGSVGVSPQRRKLFEFFKKKGYTFSEVVHPSAVVAKDARLGEGVQLMAGAVVQPGCRLGDNVLVNTGACVDHDCRIGSHVHLAPGVVLSGGVAVGEGSHVGTGAVIVQGVRLGPGVFIKANSLVKKDVGVAR